MRLGSKAKLTIGVGLAAACSFAYLGIRELNRVDPVPSAQARPQVTQAAPQILLAATTRPIKTGETITADMIRSATNSPARFPNAALPAEAIGKVATRDIPSNSLVPRTALGLETKLAIRVPKGLRAMSIDTTAEIAVAGLVRPGDVVDVQVVYPGADAVNGARGTGRSQAVTLLQMVQVLAVGDTVLGTPSSPSPGTVGAGDSQNSAQATQQARTVTLALSPDQVSTLSLAKSTGSLYLSLRNPDDDAEIAAARAVSTGPLPQQPVQPILAAAPAVAPAPRTPPPARPRQAPHAIELVVGGKQGIIYSGSGSR